jgi:hypothetical protein
LKEAPANEQYTAEAPAAASGTLLNAYVNYVARAAVIVDSDGLNAFSQQSFVPAAIPVFGDPFFSKGERATVQASGSGIQLVGDLKSTTGKVSSYSVAVVSTSNLNSGGSDLGGTIASWLAI